MSFVVFQTFEPSVVTISQSLSGINLNNVAFGSLQTKNAIPFGQFEFRNIFFSSSSLEEYGYFFCTEPVVINRSDYSYDGENYCCELPEITCPDGTCVEDQLDCDCEDDYVKCEDGSCVENEEDCDVCPIETPFKCSDGTCVSDSNDCTPPEPSPPTNPPWGGGVIVGGDEEEEGDLFPPPESNIPLGPCATQLTFLVDPAPSPTVIQTVRVKVNNTDMEKGEENTVASIVLRHAIGTNFSATVDIDLQRSYMLNFYVESCGGFFAGPPLEMGVRVFFNTTEAFTNDVVFQESSYRQFYDFNCEPGHLLGSLYVCAEEWQETNYLGIFDEEGNLVAAVPRGSKLYCSPPMCKHEGEIDENNFDPSFLNPLWGYVFFSKESVFL